MPPTLHLCRNLRFCTPPLRGCPQGPLANKSPSFHHGLLRRVSRGSQNVFLLTVSWTTKRSPREAQDCGVGVWLTGVRRRNDFQEMGTDRDNRVGMGGGLELFPTLTHWPGDTAVQCRQECG